MKTERHITLLLSFHLIEAKIAHIYFVSDTLNARSISINLWQISKINRQESIYIDT